MGDLTYRGASFKEGIAPLISLKPGVNIEHLDVTENRDSSNMQIDFSSLDKTTVSKYYGTTVATFDGVEYGLFYVDYSGDFGEAETIYLRAKASVDSISFEDEYTVFKNQIKNPSLTDKSLKIMRELNPQWAKDRGNKDINSLYSSEKGVAYLCNPTIPKLARIKSIAEEKFGINNVNYVIGAPSVELFMASYNAKYNSIYSTQYVEMWQKNGTNTFFEYLYSIDGENGYRYGLNDAIPIENTEGGMYRNISDTEWLASPWMSGDQCSDNGICSVGWNGAIGGDYCNAKLRNCTTNFFKIKCRFEIKMMSKRKNHFNYQSFGFLFQNSKLYDYIFLLHYKSN